MKGWRAQLKFDPLPVLLSSDNKSIQHFAKCALLGEPGPTEALWQVPETVKIIRKQQEKD